jgi:transposase
MTADPHYTIGIDWGSQEHAVCVCAADGTIVEERRVAHTGAALGAWVQTLLARVDGEAPRLAAALEMPRGPVVDLLLEHGIATFSLNPKQATRFRERETVAGAKDDRRDARVLAGALRTDRALFHALAPEDPVVVQLREWTRIDRELTAECTRLTNRLREQWLRYYPQLLALSGGADDAWVWRLWERAPTPAAGARLRPLTVQALLRSYRIRRLTAAEVVAELRAPALVVAAGTTDAAVGHAGQLIARLWLVRQQQEACTNELAALLDRLAGPSDPDAPNAGGPTAGPPDVTIVRSMPGVGLLVAAQLLAEAAVPLAARAYPVLRAWMGLAPVTTQSGKTRIVTMRMACNAALRDACFYWAASAARCDPASKAYYTALRARGHRHGRALRSVADRLLRILCAMLTHGTLYDPSRFAPPAIAQPTT